MPLTLSDLERLVRKQDPKAWDKLSPQEREDLLNRLNLESSNRANQKFFDDIWEPVLKERKRRRRKPL